MPEMRRTGSLPTKTIFRWRKHGCGPFECITSRPYVESIRVHSMTPMYQFSKFLIYAFQRITYTRGSSPSDGLQGTLAKITVVGCFHYGVGLQ